MLKGEEIPPTMVNGVLSKREFHFPGSSMSCLEKILHDFTDHRVVSIHAGDRVQSPSFGASIFPHIRTHIHLSLIHIQMCIRDSSICCVAKLISENVMYWLKTNSMFKLLQSWHYTKVKHRDSIFYHFLTYKIILLSQNWYCFARCLKKRSQSENYLN